MAKKCLMTCDLCASSSDDPKNKGAYNGIRESVSVKIFAGSAVLYGSGNLDLCKECLGKLKASVDGHFPDDEYTPV